MRRRLGLAGLVAACLPLLCSAGAGEGTDERAVALARELRAGYRPWAAPREVGALAEAAAFALQAGLGGLALGWALAARGGA